MSVGNLYTPASAPLGDFRAGVYYSRFLGQQALQALTLRTGLTGKMPDSSDPDIGKVTTTPGMPVIQCWELTKQKGDRITVDMKGRLNAKPQMNDAVSTDKKESLKYARDTVTLSLYTHVGDPGGIMTRQRNPHDTRMDLMAAEISWLVNLEDNLFMVHAAGARGHQVNDAWIIPTDDDPDYQDIIGNTLSDDGVTRTGNAVTPPTRSRYYLPGTATGLDNIDTTNVISLDFLTKIRARINTSNVPLNPISSSELKGQAGSYANGNSSLLIGFLSEEQYVTLKTVTGVGSFNQMVIDANTRVDFNSHPAFSDLERFMFAGILWFKCPRAIIFTPGRTAQQYNPTTGALETITVNAALPATSSVHRGIIMGAQALGVVYGDGNPPPSGNTGGMEGTGTTPALKSPYSWREDVRQGGAVLDVYARLMSGYKKLKYSWLNRSTGLLVPYDNGIVAFDTYQAAL